MELHPELLLPICIFYLVLRGLDTIEDDTSIPTKLKEPLLREFKDKLEVDGWTFDGNRPEEKDRELLVQFHNVTAEFKKMKPAYQKIIKDIADRMGKGMADYCVKAEQGDSKVDTIQEYDLYCYYVAGLVGEGLTRLFVEAGFARPELLERPNLYISMGLFLQKTNIIRDVREDEDDNRRFWPKEIWSNHVDNWEDLFKPENREKALNCNSEMILNALSHAEECLYYLAGMKEQSVFNFAAIPQSMAIATLELCFRNPAMLERNVKITKGEACGLMFQSTQNVRVICTVFRHHLRKIHKRNNPKDPNFLKISVQCGQVSFRTFFLPRVRVLTFLLQIEKFIETIFPSQRLEDAQRRVAGQKSIDEVNKAEEQKESLNETLMLLLPMVGITIFITILMVCALFSSSALSFGG